MDDDVVQKINELAEQEHHLEREHGDRPLTDEERKRLDAVKVSLDQCWDLLRQRRARRSRASTPTTPRCAANRPSRATSSNRGKSGATTAHAGSATGGGRSISATSFFGASTQ